LFTILQEASNPAEGVVPDSIVMQFVDEAFMGDLIEGLGKIDTAALQNDMSALQQWESDWQMMFHPEKCTTIHISKKRNPIHMVIHLSVPGSKYLGVRVNKDLS
jgi:hypothetical protein